MFTCISSARLVSLFSATASSHCSMWQQQQETQQYEAKRKRTKQRSSPKFRSLSPDRQGRTLRKQQQVRVLQDDCQLHCHQHRLSCIRSLTSSGAKAPIDLRTVMISGSFWLARATTNFLVGGTSISSITAPELVVPITSSFRPLGGCFFSSTSRVCSMPLLNLGPIATYSSRRSMSSRMMMEKMDCKVIVMCEQTSDD